MSPGNLVEFLFHRDNRQLQRWLGALLVGLGVAYVIGGGFGDPVDGEGIPLSPGWFREVFVVLLSLVSFIGLLLLLAGFSRRGSNGDEA